MTGMREMILDYLKLSWSKKKQLKSLYNWHDITNLSTLENDTMFLMYIRERGLILNLGVEIEKIVEPALVS